MKKCWNCGCEFETVNKEHYASLVDSYRCDTIKNIGRYEEYDQGFIDGLLVAIDIIWKA